MTTMNGWYLWTVVSFLGAIAIMLALAIAVS